MMSQMGREFVVAIKAKAFFKSLQNKNIEFTNKVSQVEKAAKKAKAEALKKQKVEKYVKPTSILAEIENLENEVHFCIVRWPS